MQTDKNNTTPKEKSELGSKIIKALQETTDEAKAEKQQKQGLKKRRKNEKIVRTALVCGNRNFFMEALQETIDDFQNEGFEVEVQFKVDLYNYCALVIGRK